MQPVRRLKPFKSRSTNSLLLLHIFDIVAPFDKTCCVVDFSRQQGLINILSNTFIRCDTFSSSSEDLPLAKSPNTLLYVGLCTLA
ncbi:hypothetical protein TNCV_1850631 [Trichonephila clavipes]|nr:hypothetical protein TNCV_1850631 [Trichonephila clavipes]